MFDHHKSKSHRLTTTDNDNVPLSSHFLDQIQYLRVPSFSRYLGLVLNYIIPLTEMKFQIYIWEPALFKLLCSFALKRQIYHSNIAVQIIRASRQDSGCGSCLRKPPKTPSVLCNFRSGRLKSKQAVKCEENKVCKSEEILTVKNCMFSYTDSFKLTMNKLWGGMFGCNNCQGLTEKYN